MPFSTGHSPSKVAFACDLKHVDQELAAYGHKPDPACRVITCNPQNLDNQQRFSNGGDSAMGDSGQVRNYIRPWTELCCFGP